MSDWHGLHDMSGDDAACRRKAFVWLSTLARRATAPTTKPATVGRKWWPASVTAGWWNHHGGLASGAQQSMLPALAMSTTFAPDAAAVHRSDKPTTAGNAAGKPYCSAPGRVCFLFVSFLCRTQRKVTGSPRRGMSYGRWAQRLPSLEPCTTCRRRRRRQSAASPWLRAPALTPSPSPASGRGEPRRSNARAVAACGCLLPSPNVRRRDPKMTKQATP